MFKWILFVSTILVICYGIYNWLNNNMLIISTYNNVLTKPIKYKDFKLTELYKINGDRYIVFEYKNNNYSIFLNIVDVDLYKEKYNKNDFDNELIEIVVKDYLDTID